MMDYRSLLVRFLGHLIESRGSIFVDADTSGINVQLTAAEKAELAVLSQEARRVARR